MAFAGMPFAHPISDHAALGRTPPDIADRQAAKERHVLLGKDEKRNGLAGIVFLLAANDAGAIGALGQFVVTPGRFPGLQEPSAFGPQPVPLVEVRIAGQAEKMVVAFKLNSVGMS